METVAPFQEIIDEIKEAGGEAFKFCYQCGKCDVVCPWNRVRKLQHAQDRPRGHLRPDRDRERGHLALHDLRHLPAAAARGASSRSRSGVALRRIATEYDVFPDVRHARPHRGGSLARRGQPAGEERAKRADWAKGLGVKPFAEGMEFLYFAGCYLSYDPRLKKVAAATAEILNKAGVDFGILGDEGELLRREHPQDGRRGALQDAWPGRTSRPSSTTA